MYRVAAGYMAHTVCSGVFISHRELSRIMAVEFGPGSDPRLAQLKPVVDYHAQTVSVKAPRHADATAVYRRGLGCVLALGEPLAELKSVSIPPRTLPSADALWPEGTKLYRNAPDIDYHRLHQALDFAISQSRNQQGRGTRGVVVVYRGRLVGEAYAPGYTRDMPLYGASMSKTVGAMLVGRLVQSGKLSLTRKELRPEWKTSGDPRKTISLDELLKATSGLRFQEEYAGTSDVDVMLFTKRDMAHFAASMPLVAEPGTRWAYSSGTANIIMGIARATFDSDEQWLRYPDQALFTPLGLRSAVFETDTSGTFISSSFLWATPRDFARLGLLLLQDGVWKGKRLLPPGWVAYMSTPAAQNKRHNYGAQTWLIDATNSTTPAPIIAMVGFGGQYVWVIPAHHLVVVRMGWDFDTPRWSQKAFVDRVVSAIITPRAPTPSQTP